MSTRANRLIITLLALSLTAGTEFASAQAKAGCDGKIIAMTMSPDTSPYNKWVALTRAITCSDGYFVTTWNDAVQLIKSYSIDKISLGWHPYSWEQGDNILILEGDGHPEDGPVMRWLSDRKLQIAVPNKSLINLKKEKYEEIEIVIKYEPDDPVERERWLKSLGLPPK